LVFDALGPLFDLIDWPLDRLWRRLLPPIRHGHRSRRSRAVHGL